MTMSEVAGVTISGQVKVIMSERVGSDYEWGGGAEGDCNCRPV